MKIKKIFILYHDSPLAIEKMKRSAESFLKFGFEVIPVKGYTAKDRETLEKECGTKISHYSRGETECTVGHILILSLIAREKEPCAVIECDTIAKTNFNNIDFNIQDGEILFLGYRVDEESDYEFPNNYEIRTCPIVRFEGAHAYAVTPLTAARLFSMLSKEISNTIDWNLGMFNIVRADLKTADPPVVVCPIDKRTFDGDQGEELYGVQYNIDVLPGFLFGLKNRDKYLIFNGKNHVNFHERHMVWGRIKQRFENIDLQNRQDNSENK
jgi:hypothetical protein